MPEILKQPDPLAKLQQVICNIGGPDSLIRYDTYNGRQHIVAPMAMLGEGVLSANGGALYYSDEEIGKNTAVWNAKPIVVNHPRNAAGDPICASDPAIIDKYGVGFMFNTMKDNKLRTEAWIDPLKAKLVEPRILEKLDKGEKMEVSTGLFTTNIMEPGEWNGIPYDGRATNYMPDHCAILPDKEGAYSIDDGGGLLQVNESTRQQRLEYVYNNDRWPQAKRDALDKTDFGDPSKRAFPIASQQDINSAKHLIGKASNPDAVKKRIIAIAKRKGLSIPAEWHGHGMESNEKPTLEANYSSMNGDATSDGKGGLKLSHSQLREKLRDKLKETKGKDPTNTGTDSSSGEVPSYSGYHYIEDTYDDSFIYSDEGGKMYQQGYSLDGDNVTFKGGKTPVKRVTEYRNAVDNSYIGNSYTQLSLRELDGMATATQKPAVTPPATPIANTDNSGQYLASGSGSPSTTAILKPQGGGGIATATMSREDMANKLIQGKDWNNADKAWLAGLSDDGMSKLYNTVYPTSVASAVASGGQASKGAEHVLTDKNKPLDLTGDGVVPPIGPSTNEKGGTTVADTNTPATGAAIPATNSGTILNPTPVVQPQQVMVNQMSEAEREALNEAVQLRTDRRNELITNIKASPKNRFSDDYLNHRKTDELVGFAAMLGLDSTPTVNQGNGLYAGAAGGALLPLINQQQPARGALPAELQPKGKPLGVPNILNESKEEIAARKAREYAGKKPVFNNG